MAFMQQNRLLDASNVGGSLPLFRADLSLFSGRIPSWQIHSGLSFYTFTTNSFSSSRDSGQSEWVSLTHVNCAKGTGLFIY